jgi:hypothetical protein
MNQINKYKDFQEFLSKHSAKNEAEGVKITPTHTRIGDKNLNIYGGSYIIPREELQSFFDLYYKEVFMKYKNEYLTEKQMDTACPILIDLDFRYNFDVEKRQHTKEHIQDLISQIYLEELKNLFVFEKNRPFPCG